MTIAVSFPGYVPCLTSSIRGSKSQLCPNVLSTCRANESYANRIIVPETIDRRRFLKVGAIGTAGSCVAFSGLGEPPGGGVCYAQVAQFIPSLYGLVPAATKAATAALVDVVMTEVFKPALQSFAEHVFKPFMDDRVEPLARGFLNWLADSVENFLNWLHKWFDARWSKSEDEKYNNNCADRFWLSEEKKVPMIKKIREVDFEAGYINCLRPRAVNAVELEGMSAEKVHGLLLPDGRRLNFGKYYEDYKKDFNLLNEMYHTTDESKFKPDEVDYIVPLIHPGDGKEYTGFAIKRHPRSPKAKDLNRALVTNWDFQKWGNDETKS